MFEHSVTPPSLDWSLAIRRNVDGLKQVVVLLWAMLGLEPGTPGAGPIPLVLQRAVRQLLIPAESALRRLVVMAARGLVAKPARSRPLAPGTVIPKGVKPHRTSFPLFDPRKSLGTEPSPPPVKLPRILVFGPDPRVAALWAHQRSSQTVKQEKDESLESTRLTARLITLTSALNDLPRQARRLLRWQSRNAQKQPASHALPKSPLRPGPPPGHRKVKRHEVDHILTECHGLARDALNPDTS